MGEASPRSPGSATAEFVVANAGVKAKRDCSLTLTLLLKGILPLDPCAQLCLSQQQHELLGGSCPGRAEFSCQAVTSQSGASQPFSTSLSPSQLQLQFIQLTGKVVNPSACSGGAEVTYPHHRGLAQLLPLGRRDGQL